eukprot:5932004-Prymnesium_polylepis.1
MSVSFSGRLRQSHSPGCRSLREPAPTHGPRRKHAGSALSQRSPNGFGDGRRAPDVHEHASRRGDCHAGCAERQPPGIRAVAVGRPTTRAECTACSLDACRAASAHHRRRARRCTV